MEGEVKKTWFDDVHEIYVEGLKRTKDILRDESIPWKKREDKCLKALKEIKKMMVECRPPEIHEDLAASVASDIVSNAERKVEGYCEHKDKGNAVEKVG